MPYAMIARDKPDRLQWRMALRDAHLAYLKANLDKILAGGAMINDDGGGGHGGIIIIDTDDRAEAERFAHNDPFTTGGLFETVVMERWRKAIFDKKFLL